MKEQQVKKTFLPQDIAVLAAIFAAGAACFLLGEGWDGMGVIILLCDALMVPFYHHGYKLEGQKGLFRLKEISLSRENKEEILAFLEGKTDSLDLHPWQKGGVLVDVYYRKGEERQFARYFDYADFSKGVEYPLHEVTKEQISILESVAIDKK
ncbi:MAG: hypothetical protein J6M31_02955 [Bacteroidales bacterium]|nr:hypothetical protein [Bacteroidales bacterium]